MIALEDLLDSQQVADLLGLSHRNSVTTYARRYRDFPAPALVRASGRIQLWARDDIVAWKDSGRADPVTTVDTGQRRRILDAASRLLLADPFSPLSVRRIAAEAGVPHPVLYRYARRKQELLEMVVEDAITRIGAALDEVGDPTWRAYLPELVRVLLTNADAVRLFALWLVEGGGSDRFPTIAIMPRMLRALTADPRCDGSGEVTAEVAVAASAALLVGAVVFAPRIEHLVGRDILTEQSLTHLVTVLCGLALTPEPSDTVRSTSVD